MKVMNVHFRKLDGVSPAAAGAVLDTLASDEDLLWPHHSWPPMRFDRPLGVGATGGHGPVRYSVEAYSRGESIRFRFTRPEGFDGIHAYEVLHEGDAVILRHVLIMRARGAALLTWPLVFRPLHDALIEDSLAQAEASLGKSATTRPWSPWVRLLRWLMSGGRARGQAVPCRKSEPMR